MSEILNGGLDQYGAGPFEREQFGTAGVEDVDGDCDDAGIDEVGRQWQGQTWAKPPEMSLSPRPSETCRLLTRRRIVRNFQILISQSANNVCKLLQFLGDFVSQTVSIPGLFPWTQLDDFSPSYSLGGTRGHFRHRAKSTLKSPAWENITT